jgi:uncharacterized protein
MRSPGTKIICTLTAIVILAVVAPAGAGADDSPPDYGRAFNVEVKSEPIYGVQAPTEDPARQQHIIRAADGTALFVETWLPKAKDGNVPPDRMPSIVVMNPYSTTVQPTGSPTTLEAMVPRGYAFVHMHVRGTGRSGGCNQEFGPLEASDGATIVKWIATRAPWSNGIVGGYGHSYSAGTILNTAARGARSHTKYLKAILAGAPPVSAYEARTLYDGVPATAFPPFTWYSYLDGSIGGHPPDTLPQKMDCQPKSFVAAADPSGDVTQWYRDRELRLHVHKIRVPVFTFHGHLDDTDSFNGNHVLPSAQDGFFNALRGDVPKVGVFGVFGHEFPSEEYYHERPASWVRPDFDAMRIAWWDHWLKGIDSGVDEWPVAQVQGTDGQWRAEDAWPHTGGRVGRLALGAAGTLGTSSPTGETRYVEAMELAGSAAPNTQAMFDSGPLSDRLELTGRPTLDLWVMLDRPDAHIAVRVETFDAAGEAIPWGTTYGLRSAQHIEPLERGLFLQSHGRPAPVLQPFQLQVRLNPTDLVVPKGGRIRVTIAGSIKLNMGLNFFGIPDPIVYGPSQPSGTATVVTVLHDCEHPSMLRFEMPDEFPDLLNVQEVDESAPVPSNPVEGPMVSDGGGIAVAEICGAGWGLS